LKNYVEKPKMTKKEITKNENKLEEILRKIYIELLKPIENYLKEEKTMVIVLDNYRTHHGVSFKQACEYLNITLIHLPPYSPKLNPIEQVWRTIKGELSTKLIKNKDFLIDNFERLFYENVDKKSFTEKWIDEYLLDKNNELLIDYICEITILPPYSPDLNPIEDVWRKIKRIISINNFRDIEELKNSFKNTFHEIIGEKSFFKEWLNEFTLTVTKIR
jgi:transposase